MSSALVLMAVIPGCATAPAAPPYEHKIASWPADLPEDEYVAFSDDENLVTHICRPTDRGSWMCEDRSDGEPEAPSGLLVQDGIRVTGPGVQAPRSRRTPPLKIRLNEATFDHEIRLDSAGLWFEEQLLVASDEFQPFELQFSGRGANLNSSMARFEERVREAVLLSGHRDDQSKDVVMVVDEMADARMAAAVSGWLLDNVDAPVLGLAVERARRSLLLGCQKARRMGDRMFECQPVEPSARPLDGVSDVTLVDVGVGLIREPKTANQCTGPGAKKCDYCDRDGIIRAIEEHGEDLRLCYEVELQTFDTLAGTVMVRFKIMPDGQVSRVELRASSMDHPPVEQCILDVIRRIDFPKPDGGACVIHYPFTFAGVK